MSLDWISWRSISSQVASPRVASAAFTRYKRQSLTCTGTDSLSPVLLLLLQQPQWERSGTISFWWSVTSISSSFHTRKEQDTRIEKLICICVALRCSESESTTRMRIGVCETSPGLLEEARGLLLKERKKSESDYRSNINVKPSRKRGKKTRATVWLI